MTNWVKNNYELGKEKKGRGAFFSFSRIYYVTTLCFDNFSEYRKKASTYNSSTMASKKFSDTTVIKRNKVLIDQKPKER